MNTRRGITEFLSVLISYILSRIIFRIFGFRYSLFGETFNLEKFIIDFGSWIIIFGVIYFFLSKMFNKNED